MLALAGPKRCVIWANIVRPPYQGVSYTRLNRALAELDRRHANLVVFDWAGMVGRHPGALSSDGVHVDGALLPHSGRRRSRPWPSAAR